MCITCVCVHVYIMCIYIYVYIYIYLFIYLFIYSCIHLFIELFIYICIHINIHMRVYIICLLPFTEFLRDYFSTTVWHCGTVSVHNQIRYIRQKQLSPLVIWIFRSRGELSRLLVGLIKG